MHSFISVEVVKTLGLVPTCKPPLFYLILFDGKTAKCEELHKDCPIQIYEHEFLADLDKFELTNFGIILGKD